MSSEVLETAAPPAAIARRQANELPAEELQAECTRYGVLGGDTHSRVAALQVKYDEEFDAAQHELAMYEQWLEDERRREEYRSAGRELEALEQAALEREPKIHAIERQARDQGEALRWTIVQSIAPKRLVVRGLSPLACCGLLRAMRSNTNVLTLDLANNKLGDAIADSLERMLERNKTLQALDLGFNELTHQSLGAIGRALLVNAVLATVVLESNPVMLLTKNPPMSRSTDGSSAAASHSSAGSNIEAFAAAITSSTSLTSLNLFNTQMSYEVGRALAQAFAKNASIISLEVGGNSLLQNDVALFSNHLRRNQQRMEATQSKSADLYYEMKERAETTRAEQAKQAKQQADLAWHEANAKQRAEIREREEWDRARVCAEADVRRLLEIEAMDKKHRERLDAEKSPKSAKGRK